MIPESQQAHEWSIFTNTANSDDNAVFGRVSPDGDHDGQKPTQALVSVIVVAYDAARFLPTCLLALQQQTYKNYEIILVDTTPYDHHTADVAKQFPHIRFIAAPKNLGYAGGNNLGFTYARGEYLAILNPDTEPDQEWLRSLVIAVSASPEPILATSKILLFDRREQINTCGNIVHYTGLATCRGLEESKEQYIQTEYVTAVSGAAFLLHRDLFYKLGGFNERFFMYLEDTDLSWRATLLGIRCLFVPDSVVYHHYETRVSPEKLFFLERNRYLMLLHNLRGITLRLMAPAILLTEIMTWGFVALRGSAYAHAKLRAYIWIIRNRASIAEGQRRVQRQRVIGDATVVREFDYRLVIGQVASPPIAFIAKIVADWPFYLWQRFVLSIIRRDA